MAAKWLIVTKTAENHTLWGCTHLYCPYKGVFPPNPGAQQLLSSAALFCGAFCYIPKNGPNCFDQFLANLCRDLGTQVLPDFSKTKILWKLFIIDNSSQPGFSWQNMRKSIFFSLLPANSRCLQSAVRNTSLILCELSGDPLRAAFKFSLY